MSVPSRNEVFAQLIEHLRLAQENAATIGHLHNANVAEGLVGSGSSSHERQMAKAWIIISEALKVMQHQVIQLAQKRMQ